MKGNGKGNDAVGRMRWLPAPPPPTCSSSVPKRIGLCARERERDCECEFEFVFVFGFESEAPTPIPAAAGGETILVVDMEIVIGGVGAL